MRTTLNLQLLSESKNVSRETFYRQNYRVHLKLCKLAFCSKALLPVNTKEAVLTINRKRTLQQPLTAENVSRETFLAAKGKIVYYPPLFPIGNFICSA